MVKKRILVVDDDPDILDVIKLSLGEEFTVIQAQNGEDALKKIYAHPPDLLILDYMMPELTGDEVCQKLRNDVLLCHLPIIMLTGKGELQDKVKGINAGVDDYIVKPFEPQELLARVKMIVRRTESDLDAAPLTKLPGNVSIYNELEKRLDAKQPLAVCYIDLDKFKAFNDRYGFAKGDGVIRETARILIKAVQEKGSGKDFIGHIGGDDFVIITIPKTVDELCKKIIQDFDQTSSGFYNDEDRRRGYMVAKDRKGTPQKIPLITISIGVVTNRHRKIAHIAQLAQIGAELKAHAKTSPVSNYVKDQRR
jgi:diguanylate cyclase (GGDEF)-like protein